MEDAADNVEEGEAGKDVHDARVLGEAVEDAPDGVPVEEGDGAGEDSSEGQVVQPPAAVEQAAAEPEAPDQAGPDKTQNEACVDEEKSVLLVLRTRR